MLTCLAVRSVTDEGGAGWYVVGVEHGVAADELQGWDRGEGGRAGGKEGGDEEVSA